MRFLINMRSGSFIGSGSVEGLHWKEGVEAAIAKASEDDAELIGIEVIDEPVAETRIPNVGEVWMKPFGEKYVVQERDLLSGSWIGGRFVCAKAHEDGDLSYHCNTPYCRCGKI